MYDLNISQNLSYLIETNIINKETSTWSGICNGGGFTVKVESGGEQDFFLLNDGKSKIEYYRPRARDLSFVEKTFIAETILDVEYTLQLNFYAETDPGWAVSWSSFVDCTDGSECVDNQCEDESSCHIYDEQYPNRLGRIHPESFADYFISQELFEN